MKITRTPLILTSNHYSREYGIERSVGCHISAVIDVLKRVHGGRGGKSYGDSEFTEQDLERLRVLGFVFERTMIHEDDERYSVLSVPRSVDPVEQERMWEEALSRHARDVAVDPGLSFPGEDMFCVRCDTTMPGENVGREHCKTTGHKGIFYTIDAVMCPPRYRFGVREWKWTARSAGRTGIDHMNGIPEWPWQVMWYASMIGTDYGELDAMFSRGDYTTKKPVLLPFRFAMEFAESDLHRNFTMLISTARSEEMI